MSSDFDIKSQLLIAVENWLNDISFFAADEPNGTTERMVAWQNLERVLFSLDKTLIHLLVLKQRQMIDTLVQHISGSAYSANRDVWFLAAKCLRACYQALHSNLWDNGEFCAIDLMFYLMGVVEKIIDERAGEDGFKYVVQAMDLWGAVLASESSTEEIYASFVGCLSQLILQSASGSFYKKKLASFLQSYIFSLAAAARTELLCTLFSTDSWDSAAGAVPGTETGTGSVATARLPIGGSDQLLVTLCTNRSITQHPLIALSIIRCHASLACVPVLRYGQSSSTHASWQVAGLLQQDTIITDFLVHLQLCLVDGSLSLAVPPTFRATLVESLCPLVCAPNASLCCAARRLMHIVATDRQDLVELTASASSTATVSMRQVFPDQASVVRTGAAVMNGVRQVLEDLSGDRLLGDNKPSEELCAAVDEILELFLECVVTRALVGDASLGEVAGKLSETLLFCSKVVRPKLAPSLHMLLQKGANCSIRGCLQLLEANARFLGAQRVSAIPSIPPPQSHPASASAAPASVGFVAHTMASAARNAVTSRREIIDLTSSSAPSKDSWDFLKPAAVPTHKPPAVPSGPFSKQTTKAPSGPFSKLDNSITRAERSAGQSSNSSNSSNKESVLDRMAREEQEQLERDRKNLFRKRIFGDLDANPPPNSDDLTGSVGKHAKLSSEFGAHVSWLSAKAPTAKEQETSWEQQIRELREAKEQARRLAEQKASSAAGSGERVHNWGGEEATANAGACAGTGAAVSRPARIGRHRSALLDDNTGYDDDEDGAEAGEGPAAVSRKVVDWRTLLQMDKPSAAVQNATASSAAAAASTVDVSGLMQMYTSGQMTAAAGKRGARPEVSFSEAMAAISIDPIVRMLLQCQLAELCAEARDGGQGRNSSSADSVELQPAPVRFLQEEHYIESFTPILLAEVKSAVASFINGENTSDEARYSSSGGPAGQAAASSEPLRVRCLLKTERPGQPKLQEAVVSPLLDEKHRGRLNKDDLVLVMTTGAHAGNLHVLSARII